ncbi:MAG TPA: molybdopterin-dependent oxidoreductase [Acidobacteriaceae bacterium]|nr:molybdopterin-dependent oxidoreductase [Acidobacteriaceae bacterium]
MGRLQAPLRKVLNFNRDVVRTVFDERGLAPEYPVARSVELRLNGTVGLEKQLDLPSWRLQFAGVDNAATHPRYVNDLTLYQYRYHGKLGENQQAQDVKAAPGNADTSKTGAKKQAAEQPSSGYGESSKQLTLAERFDAMNRQINHKRVRGDGEAGPSGSGLLDGTPGLLLTMDDLMKFPKIELVTEFKCVEGWSQIVHWGGIRLRDLLDAYPPAKINGKESAYLYMETPDGNYYGGYDMAAARHPQSLLVTEMGGQALTQHHGAPLRLHMPVKYGYKQLKRIGLIAYMDQRPDDYWTKLGYDWYAGL